MDSKGYSDKISDQNLENIIGTWKKKIPVIKWQRTSLNSIYALVFCGRQNLQTMKKKYLVEKSLSKVLGCSRATLGTLTVKREKKGIKR